MRRRRLAVIAALVCGLSTHCGELDEAAETEVVDVRSPALTLPSALRRSPKDRPEAVPANYVWTRSGFMHPSCVITVTSGDTVGDDMLVRGADGSPHGEILPCQYPRYDRHGAPVDSMAPQTYRRVYDGWVVDYKRDGALPAGALLTTEWEVPPAPTNIGGQDMGFFNDILLAGPGGYDILQPVLDYWATNRYYQIISEHCCVGGNDVQTRGIRVAPGDVIRGTVQGTDCSASGACAGWTVLTTNLENLAIKTARVSQVTAVVASRDYTHRVGQLGSSSERCCCSARHYGAAGDGLASSRPLC